MEINRISSNFSLHSSFFSLSFNKITTLALSILACAKTTASGPVAYAACFMACEATLTLMDPSNAVRYAPICFEGCKTALALPGP